MRTFMTYFNTTIFPTKRRLAWDNQFYNRLLQTIFDPDKVLDAINQQKAISFSNDAIDDLTHEELQQAIQAIDDNTVSNYSLTNYPVGFEFIGNVGLSVSELKELSQSTQLLYHVVLSDVMRSFIDPDSEGNQSEIQTFYENYISKYPEQEQYALDEAQKYFNHMLGLAEPIIRAHRRIALADRSLQSTLKKCDSQPPVNEAVGDICQEVYRLSQQVKSAADIDVLADVLNQCSSVLMNPNADTITSCIEKANSLSNQSLTKSLSGMLLTFAGFMLLSASIMVAVESFGIAAPLSALGMALGESLICGSFAASSAFLGAGGASYGSYLFFKHSESNLLSKRLHSFANTAGNSQMETQPTF